MITDRTITDEHLRGVLQCVCNMTNDPDVQLSLLTLALLTAAKTLGIPKAMITKQIDAAWEHANALARGKILKAGSQFVGLPAVGRD